MKNKLFLICTVGILFSSCIKNTIYNTPYPEKGSLALNIEWDNLHAGDAIPTQYASYADKTEIIHQKQGETIIVETENQKQIAIYNLPNGITIDSGIATLNNDSHTGSFVLFPEHLYYDEIKLNVPKDLLQTVNFKTKRGTVALEITLDYDKTLLSNIVSTDIELTGIATSRNLLTGELISQGDITQNYKFDASKSSLTLNYNIFGTTGTEQLLRFIFETPTGQKIISVSNISQILAEVNSNMLSVEASAKLSLPNPIQLEANGTDIGGITDWIHEYSSPEEGTAN